MKEQPNMPAPDRTIRVIPPKVGGTQCRVLAPTEFVHNTSGGGGGSQTVQWANRTGDSITVFIGAGILEAPGGGGSGPHVITIASGAEGPTPALRIAPGAVSKVYTYLVFCQATNSLAIGN